MQYSSKTLVRGDLTMLGRRPKIDKKRYEDYNIMDKGP